MLNCNTDCYILASFSLSPEYLLLVEMAVSEMQIFTSIERHTELL